MNGHSSGRAEIRSRGVGSDGAPAEGSFFLHLYQIHIKYISGHLIKMNRGSGKSSDETLIEMDRTAWSGGGKCLLHAFTRFHTWECFKRKNKTQ